MIGQIVELMLILATAAGTDQTFNYSVMRVKLLRDEPGELRIDPGSIRYRSEDGETSIQIPLEDVYEIDLSDPRIIRIATYDQLKRKLSGRKSFTFKLREARHDEALVRFLAGALNRPVIGAYALDRKPPFEMAAYHRHHFGGCHGKIQISPEGIRFVSERAPDSRTWLYRDIATIGSMSPFHFRVSSMSETYNFDLKERLAEEAYQMAWQRVYRLSGLLCIDSLEDVARDGALREVLH